MLYETKFLISLLLTLAIEIPILLIFMKFIFRARKINNFNIIIAGLLASALTLPYLWFVFPSFVNASYYFILGEIGVTIIEAMVYCFILRLDIGIL
jgi:hypothetical protein